MSYGHWLSHVLSLVKIWDGLWEDQNDLVKSHVNLEAGVHELHLLFATPQTSFLPHKEISPHSAFGSCSDSCASGWSLMLFRLDTSWVVHPSCPRRLHGLSVSVPRSGASRKYPVNPGQEREWTVTSSLSFPRWVTLSTKMPSFTVQPAYRQESRGLELGRAGLEPDPLTFCFLLALPWAVLLIFLSLSFLIWNGTDHAYNWYSYWKRWRKYINRNYVVYSLAQREHTATVTINNTTLTTYGGVRRLWV